jgi:hypothetical protein
MNKLFSIALFLVGICSLASITSQAQTCPQIQFSYDEAGNRVQRKLTTVPCKRTQDAPANNLIANVYPNPAHDKINIELQEDAAVPESKITLYDLNGREIYSTISSSLQIQVDVSALLPGTYLLKVERGKEQATYNVSKN